ncbi:oxidoreductase domain containing protein [Gracilaria domingensis]|nr:oxidoreductase domain containing protein [Gracilaria domingensis]
MGSNVVRLGIISTALISDVIVKSVTFVDGIECTAIASRDANRAQKYAEKHDIKHACTYEEILNAPVDAIYVPLPTALATEWAVRSANAGKHVFVDKPFGCASQVEEIKNACEEANVIFMDATHFVHATRTKEVRKRIMNGDIGKLKRVQATYCIPMPNLATNIRSKPELEPMTLWGDLGWYVCRAAVALLGVDATRNILRVHCTSKAHKRFPMVVQSVEGVVEFGTDDVDKISLCFVIDCTSTVIMRATAIGEMGYVEMDGYGVPPTQSSVFEAVRKPEDYTDDIAYIFQRSVSKIEGDDDYQWCYPSPEEIHVDEGGRSQATKMVQEFVRMIQENDLNASSKWMVETMTTQRIVDAVYEKVKEQHGWGV